MHISSLMEWYHFMHVGRSGSSVSQAAAYTKSGSSKLDVGPHGLGSGTGHKPRVLFQV